MQLPHRRPLLRGAFRESDGLWTKHGVSGNYTVPVRFGGASVAVAKPSLNSLGIAAFRGLGWFHPTKKAVRHGSPLPTGRNVLLAPPEFAGDLFARGKESPAVRERHAFSAELQTDSIATEKE